MKKILLLAMCALVSGLALGQIIHHEISASNGVRIESMTTVSDFGNNYDSYVIGTTYDKKVFIGQLDNYTPIGLNSTTFKLFQLPDTHSGYFFNGAFVDMDGNIVAYGYCGNSTYSNIGLIVKYYMSSNTATSIDYTISSVNNSIVEDGCWGVLSNNNKVYMFVVNNNYIIRVPYTITGTPMVAKKFNPSNYEAMSVSWDSFNSKFIVSGSTGTNCFIGTFSNAISIPNPNFNIYTMPSNLTLAEYTGRHILSGNMQYSDSIAYLVQDFRDSNTGTDGVWVMKVNYLSNNVVGSMGYKFGSSKVAIFDIANNYDYLFVLGHHIGAHNSTPFSKRYLMQINLYNSTDVLTYHLKTIPQVSAFRNTNGSFLSRIIFNQSTFYVQAAGAYHDNGYLTEAYMLNDETCDSLINNYLYPINYTTTRTPICTTTNIASVWGTLTKTLVSSSTTETFTMTEECSSGLERDYESLIENTKTRLANKVQLTEKNKQILPEAEIDVQDNNTFVCSKFNGTCKYVVYDIQGKIVSNGTTQNGNTNYLDGLIPGLYLIKVTDSNNGIATKKIVVY